MRHLISIGFDELHEDVPAEAYDHDDILSLDDADVILFRTPIAPPTYGSYLGKPSLDDDPSFQYKRILDHWRSELRRALLSGKTVFVELGNLQEVYVGTGQKQYSGTGRNARVTRIVDSITNYSAIPLAFSDLQSGYGAEMRLHPKGRILNQYWKQFSDISAYMVRFAEQPAWQPLVTTKVQTALVSAAIPVKGGGCILLLPRISIPTKPVSKNKQVSMAFVQELLNIDSVLRGSEDAAPPDWISQPEYSTPRIKEKAGESLKVQSEAREIAKRQEELERELAEAHLLQSLLYGQSKKLEQAVLYALELMGIKASNYHNDGSEFDVLFDIDGIRMLGEVEGKDNTAINIDKISQLERNVSEDFHREDISEYAKGVLFGNPQRLTAPTQRTVAFTEKCVASAARNHFALVLTASMFAPASYLESTDDPDYASRCRKALLEDDGSVVAFPEPSFATLGDQAVAPLVETIADAATDE